MANISRRTERIKQMGLEDQLKKLEQSIRSLEDDNSQLRAERDALRKHLENLEMHNTDLVAEIRRLKAENLALTDRDIIELEPFSDVSSLPTRPSTAETGGYDESKSGEEIPQREEYTITRQIIDNVTQTLLAAKDIKVNAGHKDMLATGRGDVLVVYFQLTQHAEDLYGYSIFNHDVINSPELLNQIDNKNNIQLYVHRSKQQRNDLKSAGTVSVVVNNSGGVESPMHRVDSGDIVLWIRTDESVNNIKAKVAGVFRSTFLSTLNFQCSQREKCEETEQNVEIVADIIGGAYQDIRPEPTQLEIQRKVERPVRRIAAPSFSMQEYISYLEVPRLYSNGEDLFERYWNGEDVWKPDYVFEDIVGEGRIERQKRYMQWSDNADTKARVSKFQRLQKAVAVKNVVKYIMEMLDYFHQRLDIPFTSQTFIDSEKNFFYGYDIGKHDHLTGPTPILEDLIDHMYDVRIGLVFIDELCHLVIRGLTKTEAQSPDDGTWLRFLERVNAGAKRYHDENGEHQRFKRINYIAYIQRIFKDTVPEPPNALSYAQGGDKRKEQGKVIVEDTFKRYEMERLYAYTPHLSLRNYYEAAMALGVENIFDFMAPDRFVLPKLESMLEIKTGQLSVKDNLLLPWNVDGYRLQRPEFLFLAHWREHVTHSVNEVFDTMLDVMVKNKTLRDLDKFQLVNKGEYLLKSFLIVGGIGSLRVEFNTLMNSIMIEAGKMLEERYMMYKRERPLNLRDRRSATHEQEYYIYEDVFEYIKVYNPEWEKETYRNANPILWITGLGNLFGTRREPGTYGNVMIQSLTDIETAVLYQLDDMLRYFKEQDDYY